MWKHATEESQLWNCKLQPRPSSQRPWGPTLSACCCSFKIACQLWLGWLGVGDIGAVVNFGRVQNIWNITNMSFESQNQNLCNKQIFAGLGGVGWVVRSLGHLSRSNVNPPISTIRNFVMVEKVSCIVVRRSGEKDGGEVFTWCENQWRRGDSEGRCWLTWELWRPPPSWKWRPGPACPAPCRPACLPASRTSQGWQKWGASQSSFWVLLVKI